MSGGVETGNGFEAFSDDLVELIFYTAMCLKGDGLISKDERGRANGSDRPPFSPNQITETLNWLDAKLPNWRTAPPPKPVRYIDE